MRLNSWEVRSWPGHAEGPVWSLQPLPPCLEAGCLGGFSQQRQVFLYETSFSLKNFENYLSEVQNVGMKIRRLCHSPDALSVTGLIL